MKTILIASQKGGSGKTTLARNLAVTAGIMKVVRRKLTMLDAATKLEDLRVPPATGLRRCKATGKGNTRSG